MKTFHHLTDHLVNSFALVLVHRAELITTLMDLLPVEALHPGVRARSIRQGEPGPATVSTKDGELTADLVVLADGLRSQLRHGLFPEHPGYRYAGYTSWADGHEAADRDAGTRRDLGPAG